MKLLKWFRKSKVYNVNNKPEAQFKPTFKEAKLEPMLRGRERPIQMIVVHYSATHTAGSCYDILKRRQLSVHYTIARDGVLWRHVAEEDRCAHAGGSRWAGEGRVNHRSLGFEIANMGWVDGLHSYSTEGQRVFDPAKNGIEEIGLDPENRVFSRIETYNGIPTAVLTRTPCASFQDHRAQWKNKLWSNYPDKQLEACFWLIWEWMKRHDILPENVVGHDHIDPKRKQDPGPHFPWARLDAYLEARQHECPKLFDTTHRSRERIRAVQSHLTRLDLNPGPIDGLWGPRTEHALRQAIAKYGGTYGFPDLIAASSNTVTITAALRRVPA